VIHIECLIEKIELIDDISQNQRLYLLSLQDVSLYVNWKEAKESLFGTSYAGK